MTIADKITAEDVEWAKEALKRDFPDGDYRHDKDDTDKNKIGGEVKVDSETTQAIRSSIQAKIDALLVESKGLANKIDGVQGDIISAVKHRNSLMDRQTDIARQIANLKVSLDIL